MLSESEKRHEKDAEWSGPKGVSEVVQLRFSLVQVRSEEWRYWSLQSAVDAPIPIGPTSLPSRAVQTQRTTSQPSRSKNCSKSIDRCTSRTSQSCSSLWPYVLHNYHSSPLPTPLSTFSTERVWQLVTLIFFSFLPTSWSLCFVRHGTSLSITCNPPRVFLFRSTIRAG